MRSDEGGAALELALAQPLEGITQRVGHAIDVESAALGPLRFVPRVDARSIAREVAVRLVHRRSQARRQAEPTRTSSAPAVTSCSSKTSRVVRASSSRTPPFSSAFR